MCSSTRCLGVQAPPRRRRRGGGRGQPRHDGVHVHRLRRRRGRQLGQRARRHAEAAKSSGRIAAQTFRQVMSQRIREVERDRKFEEYANREGDIVTGIIQQTDTRYTLLDLGRVEALLPQAEQVPFERPQPGDRCKAYIVEVRKHGQGPADRRQPHAPGSDQAAVRAGGARDRRRHRRDQGLRPRARAPHEDRGLVERPQRRSRRRLRRRPRRSCAHGRQRAARREDRHRPVQRGLRRLRRQGAVAGQGQCRSSSPTTARRPTSSFPTTSSAWRSARRARTPASPPGSPACASTSAPRPSSPRACRPATSSTTTSSTPRASGSPTPRPARWSGTPPMAR